MQVHDYPYFAQSKTVTAPTVTLGVDVAGIRIQEAPMGSGTSRSRPPEAIRRTCVEEAVGTDVEASTQELERPFINTVVVGGAGTCACFQRLYLVLFLKCASHML